MIRPVLVLLTCVWTAFAADEPLVPLDEQPTPFSVWLDFPALSNPETADPSLPIWFESLRAETIPGIAGMSPKTTFRIRVRRLPALQREMMVRVYFDDIPGFQPVVTAWSEAGYQRYTSGPLGKGVGYPTSENVIVPLDGTDYVDIEVAGDGTTVRGALASSLKKVEMKQAMDFTDAANGGKLVDPFGNLPSAKPDPEDKRLFGRVKATLQEDVVNLSTTGQTEHEMPFKLVARPLAAVVTFEVLNADLTAEPLVFANDEACAAHVHWPDLADPGFRGEARGTEAYTRFHYTGWLRAQAVVPIGVLQAGLNKITIAVSEDSGPVAIRNIELQLKQNWKHFDYILTPTHP